MSRVGRAFKITGKIIKFIIGLIIAFIVGILIWRMVSSSDPKSMETLSVNKNTYDAYAQHGDSLYMFYQSQRSITSTDRNYGYFAVTDAEFIPQANQVQITVRYNTSTIRHLTQDYDLGQTPSRDSDLFDVTLLFATDLTPDDPSDNDTNSEESVLFTRCHASSVTSEKKNLYNYRRFVFDLGDADIDLQQLLDSGLLLAVYTDIYYNQDINYDQAAYGTLCLYDYATENRVRKLTSGDKKAFEAWAEANK